MDREEDIVGSPASTASALPRLPTVRFFHAGGQANVRPELDALIRTGTKFFRSAVCFFTSAGSVVLQRHASFLSRNGSFFVASIDPPTDLEALRELHVRAPGHIYLHLGGSTPEEINVGRALMHSKVMLAVGEDICRLWVGSHNLTGQAIEGGNFEAAIEITAAESFKPVQDAIDHLEVCRATAELFDPSQMGRYREIQERRQSRPPEIEPKKLLVIHAEAEQAPPPTPFTVYLCVVPIDFDRYFVIDREVRLYLHPAETLRRGVPADFRHVRLYTGSLTALVRTDRHPLNTGIVGQFGAADCELDIPDTIQPPLMFPAGRSRVTPTSQVVLRIDAIGRVGDEVYSLASSPVRHEYDTSGLNELHPIDWEMRRFFTPESVAKGNLVYRPVRGVKQLVRVAGYEETMRSVEPASAENRGSQMLKLEYQAKAAARPADAFFFVTKHVINQRRQ
jgi:hypothetical protein